MSLSSAGVDMSRNHLLRMVLVFSEGDGDGLDNVKDHAISITELKKSGKRHFKATAENLETGVVFTSSKDNAKILEILPLEFWPSFVREYLLVGPSDEQITLF